MPTEIISNVDPESRVGSGMTLPADATSKVEAPVIGPIVYKPGVDPVREYVSAEPRLFVSRYIKSLPQWIDDITRDFGSDLYERMLNDAQCFSTVNVFKTAILADGYRVVPNIKDKHNPLYQDSKKAAELCERCIENMDSEGTEERPFESFLFELLDGMALGHKLAEIMFRPEDYGPDAGKLTIESLKMKPRGTYAFIVDVKNNIIGLLCLIPGSGAPVITGMIAADPAHLSNLLPRQKFILYTHAPKDNDPRGRSVLRPAYDPWWTKAQVKGEWLKCLAQFGGPSLWGTTPEGAQSVVPVDSEGNPTGAAILTPEEILVARLQEIQNGSVGAFPYGTNIQAIPVGGTGVGDPFVAAIDLCDRQIAKAVLGQTLATEEGEHMARAASQTHQDIIDLCVKYGRKSLAGSVRRDLFRTLIRVNVGRTAARFITPQLEMTVSNQSDWSKDASAATALLASGLLDEVQQAIVFERLGLPPSTKAISLPQPGQPPAPGQPQPGQAALPSPQAGPQAQPQGQAAFEDDLSITDEDLKESARWIRSLLLPEVSNLKD